MLTSTAAGDHEGLILELNRRKGHREKSGKTDQRENKEILFLKSCHVKLDEKALCAAGVLKGR